MSAPVSGRVPADVVSPADYEAAARAVLDPAVWAWLAGAAGDEHTLAANRRAWSAMALRPRVLRDLAHGHTRRTLFGRVLAHPVMLAPVAHQRLVHPDGEIATALAAAAQQAGMVLSLQASTALEDVAAAVRDDAARGPLWLQLHLHDRGFTRELLRRAEAAGFEAFVLTVDAPVQGVRDRERRAGFALPAGLGTPNLRGLVRPPAEPVRAGQSAVFDALMPRAATWRDVEWLRGETDRPLLLKGVLHEDDAAQAVACGVDGLVVSNHGGRTLDAAVTTAWALPRIAARVDVPLLVDGGITRGTDVLKALALGARAVLIGRPQLHALAVAGALGVAQLLRLLRDELEAAMALTGVATLDQVSRELLAPVGAMP